MTLLRYFQHILSRLVGWLAERRWGMITRWAIKIFIHHYQVNMQEAQCENICDYQTFSAFFTRYLKPELRPIAQGPSLILSPVDGIISQLGQCQESGLLQAKGRYYTLQALLTDPQMASMFGQGYFLTAYLAPKHYHRVHMPCAGRLLRTIYVPGYLFSVKPRTVNKIDHLFARNERVICLFETDHGPMAVILIGALLVGSMRMSFNTTQDYTAENLFFQSGQEIGYFTMGSTVIILFGNSSIQWQPECQAGTEIKFGEQIGIIH